MSVADRVFICRMLEKMEHNKAYADKLGIGDASTYNGKLAGYKADGVSGRSLK